MQTQEPAPGGSQSVAGSNIVVPPSRLLASPAFIGAYPEIINPHLIPAESRVAMEESWTRGRFEERRLEVFRVRNAILIDECLILDRDLRVVSNASDPYDAGEIDHALNKINQELDARILPHYAGLGVVSKRRAAHNYGHFLMEMLPIAVLARSVYPEADHQYLVHRVPPQMQDVVFRAFRLLGFKLDKLLVKGMQEPVLFEELAIIRGLTEHGTYMSPLSVAVVGSMAERVAPGPHKRLFVRRVPGWRRGRALLNEDAIAERLVNRGFHVIEPGSMSLDDQIAAFRGAEHVVGALGAAITNIVFCNPGTRVTLLVPAAYPDTFFWFIATHRRLEYVEIRCQQHLLEDGPEPAWNGNFTVSETDIRRLEALGTGATAVPDDLPPEVAAHVRGIGDTRGRLGEWIGTTGSRRWIEGLSIAPAAEIGSDAIEYRAVLGPNWYTRWMTAGKFCGSRGFDLPIMGLSVRLQGRAAELYDCTCEATFVDGSRIGPLAGGEICASDSLAALEAFRVSLIPR
jgi:capsular polysaccharide biosynthesis protein